MKRWFVVLALGSLVLEDYFSQLSGAIPARMQKTPYPFEVRGWLLVAHPSYKLDQ